MQICDLLGFGQYVGPNDFVKNFAFKCGISQVIQVWQQKEATTHMQQIDCVK